MLAFLAFDFPPGNDIHLYLNVLSDCFCCWCCFWLLVFCFCFCFANMVQIKKLQLWKYIFYFKLDIFFIFISNVIPFPSFLVESPYPIPPLPTSMRVFLYSPTHSCLPDLAFPYTGALSLHRTKGFSFHWLMPDKVILCYICSWSCGSFYVYSLVGGLVPGSSVGRGGDMVCWYCCFSYGVAYPFSSFSPFSNSSVGDPMLSPMVGCKHLPLV